MDARTELRGGYGEGRRAGGRAGVHACGRPDVRMGGRADERSGWQICGRGVHATVEMRAGAMLQRREEKKSREPAESRRLATADGG